MSDFPAKSEREKDDGLETLSVAKRSKVDKMPEAVSANLTGSHGEPRQEP
jgi:hypothetical protein